jgi:hypothetical protein
MTQLDAARIAELELRGALGTKSIRPRNSISGTVARVRAAMVMLSVFVSMMLIFCGFWTLGTWIRSR